MPGSLPLSHLTQEPIVQTAEGVILIESPGARLDNSGNLIINANAALYEMAVTVDKHGNMSVNAVRDGRSHAVLRDAALLPPIDDVRVAVELEIWAQSQEDLPDADPAIENLHIIRARELYYNNGDQNCEF